MLPVKSYTIQEGDFPGEKAENITQEAKTSVRMRAYHHEKHEGALDWSEKNPVQEKE